MFNICFEKNGNIVYHSECTKKHLTECVNGFYLGESLYIEINENMYEISSLRIRDCTNAFISTKDNIKYYCSGAALKENNLFFKR